MLGSVIVLAGLVGTAAALSPPTPGPSPSPRAVYDACADADADGFLTVTDGVQILRAAAGLPTTCTPYRCDVNGDDAVTVSDGVKILLRVTGFLPAYSYQCPLPSHVRDLSGFATFVYTLGPAFGFCATHGEVVDAEITRRAGGAYHARIGVAEEGPLGDAACIEPPWWGTCTVAVPALDRLLSDDEVEGLRKAFSEVEIYDARSASCAIIAYDPCVSAEIRWDGVTVSGDFCAAPWIQDFPVAQALNALVAASEDVAR